ncbi:hypothetical protein ACWCQZ_08720 [Streptomyces sp. NPDC002285]
MAQPHLELDGLTYLDPRREAPSARVHNHLWVGGGQGWHNLALERRTR